LESVHNSRGELTVAFLRDGRSVAYLNVEAASPGD
jgi:hypothetical protein